MAAAPGKRQQAPRRPVHHKAEASLDAYLAAAGIAAEKDSPLWRSMPLAGSARAG